MGKIVKLIMAASNHLKRNLVTGRTAMQLRSDPNQILEISRFRMELSNDSPADSSEYRRPPAFINSKIPRPIKKQGFQAPQIAFEKVKDDKIIIPNDTDASDISVIDITDNMLKDSLADVLRQLEEIKQTIATLTEEINEIKGKNKKKTENNQQAELTER